jgi:hypothetical protein
MNSIHLTREQIAEVLANKTVNVQIDDSPVRVLVSLVERQTADWAGLAAHDNMRHSG